MRYLLADLAVLPRAAIVVEDRYSSIFRLQRVRPAVVAEALAEAQIRFSSVPIVFCETRKLAQEWTYRFLGAALAYLAEDDAARARTEQLPIAGPLEPAPTSRPTRRRAPRALAVPATEVRAWARQAGFTVADRGRLPAAILTAYEAATRQCGAPGHS